jgi:hypothetical protein
VTTRVVACVILIAAFQQEMFLPEHIGVLQIGNLVGCTDTPDAKSGGAMQSIDKTMLAAFVTEAHAIFAELAQKGGPLSNQADAETIADENVVVQNVVAKLQLRGLRELEAHYLETFRDLEGDIRRQVDVRLFKKSGFTLNRARTDAIQRGQEVFSQGTVGSEEDYTNLRIYFEILKDSADPREYDAEKLLSQFSAKFDQ